MSTNKRKLYENIMRNVGRAVSCALNEARGKTSLENDIDAYNAIDIQLNRDPYDKYPYSQKQKEMESDWRDIEFEDKNAREQFSRRQDIDNLRNDYKSNSYWEMNGAENFNNRRENDDIEKFLNTNHDKTIENLFHYKFKKDERGRYWKSNINGSKTEYLFIENIDDFLDGLILSGRYMMIPRNINPDAHKKITIYYTNDDLFYRNKPPREREINPEAWLFLILKHYTKDIDGVNYDFVARHYDEYVPTIRKNFRNRARYGE